MKHATAFLVLFASIHHVDAIFCNRDCDLGNECKYVKKNVDDPKKDPCYKTSTKAAAVCTQENCQLYHCCKLNTPGACPASCPDFLTCDLCKGEDPNGFTYDEKFPFYCGKEDISLTSVCGMSGADCCPDFATKSPTPSPTTPPPTTSDPTVTPTPRPTADIPCICSPRTYAIKVNNFIDSCSTGPVDFSKLCNNNPLFNPGVAGTDMNSAFCEVSETTFSDRDIPRDVLYVAWKPDGIVVKECTTYNKANKDCGYGGKKIYQGAIGIGNELQIESLDSSNLDPNQCAYQQQPKDVPQGARLELEGQYFTASAEVGTVKITLNWEYTYECAPEPFSTRVKFWESEFGKPLIEIGSAQGPYPELCNANGCPSGAAGAADATSSEPDDTGSDEVLPATSELEDPAPETLGASSGASCEDIADKKPCMQADCLWDNVEKLCSDSTDTDEGPLLAKSAVEESQALDEKPEPSAASAVASAWGVVTGLAMWFIMG